MKTPMLIAFALCVALCPVRAQAPKPLRLAVIGIGKLPTWFIDSMKDAGPKAGLSIEFVGKSDDRLDYMITVNQIGGLANVVIALDPRGEVAASVVRARRISDNGAAEAAAKEMAKQLAALTK
jgi:hypothetical protein